MNPASLDDLLQPVQDGMGAGVDAEYPALPALGLLLPQDLQQLLFLGPEAIAVQRRWASHRDESPRLIDVSDRLPVLGIIGIGQQGMEHCRQELMVAFPQKLFHGLLEIGFHLPVGFFKLRTHANRSRMLVVTRADPQQHPSG